MIVYLVDWRDRVSSGVRVAWSFGASEVVLVGSSPPPKRRHLYTANRIAARAGSLPDDLTRTLMLEVRGRTRLKDVDWGDVDGVAVGGSATTLWGPLTARIDARPPCLIGDQALAIGLYAWGLSR